LTTLSLGFGRLVPPLEEGPCSLKGESQLGTPSTFALAASFADGWPSRSREV
jgi:hypothetical protein